MQSSKDLPEPALLARETGPDGLEDLIARNRRWAAAKTHGDTEFFARLLAGQKPPYLLVGCVDSRVFAERLFDLGPGQCLVHRNVANQTSATDTGFQATLQFAVDVLNVRHVIVKGHYGCGGVAAAMGPERGDRIDDWVGPIRALARDHAAELAASDSPADMLSELNLLAQIKQLTDNPIVRSCWAAGRKLSIHGWIYGIGDGLIRPVCEPVSAPPES